MSMSKLMKVSALFVFALAIGPIAAETVVQRVQPRDGAEVKGKIGAIDTHNRTVTLVISTFDRKAGQANEEEKVYSVQKDTVILQDGVAAKLEELKKGWPTAMKVNEKAVLSITVEGGTIRGKFKSINPERNTITVIAGRDMSDKIFHLLKTTKVLGEGGKASKVQDLQPGADIQLTTSVQGDNTVIRIQPVTVEKKKRGD